ncbi:MAG: succinate dehydrogenase hydrophobic membrane anchor subunit [Thermoleophilia bacterium]
MVRQEVLRKGEGGAWPWFLQRVTAVLLLYGLTVHLVVLHIFNLGQLSFDNIADRLASGFFVFTDVLLLGAAVFHGLNGVRMVLLDYGFRGSNRTILDVFLVVFGLAAFVYGVYALWPWIT